MLRFSALARTGRTSSVWSIAQRTHVNLSRALHVTRASTDSTSKPPAASTSAAAQPRTSVPPSPIVDVGTAAATPDTRTPTNAPIKSSNASPGTSASSSLVSSAGSRSSSSLSRVVVVALAAVLAFYVIDADTRAEHIDIIHTFINGKTNQNSKQIRAAAEKKNVATDKHSTATEQQENAAAAAAAAKEREKALQQQKESAEALSARRRADAAAELAALESVLPILRDLHESDVTWAREHRLLTFQQKQRAFVTRVGNLSSGVEVVIETAPLADGDGTQSLEDAQRVERDLQRQLSVMRRQKTAELHDRTSEAIEAVDERMMQQFADIVHQQAQYLNAYSEATVQQHELELTQQLQADQHREVEKNVNELPRGGSALLAARAER